VNVAPTARLVGGIDERLDAGAASLGLEMSIEQRERLLAFLALLMQWNRIYNLVATRDAGEILTLHVLDCLAAVAPLRRVLASRPEPRLADVGSGGGLPGAVFAIMNRELDVTCIDSVGKKAAFVRHVASALQLNNLSAEHGRVEQLRSPGFDIVTSRAFASLVDFVRLTQSLRAEEGVWMAMKGKRPDAEIEALPESVQVFHVEHLIVPNLSAARCIVWIQGQTYHSRKVSEHS